MTGEEARLTLRARKIKIFSMGGTIDKVYFDELSAYEVGEPQAGLLLAEARAVFEFEVEEVARKDSLRLSDEDRQRLRQRIELDPCPHILVTHGTDRMIETGRSLEGIPDKRIVLVGAMSPARFKGSDASFNLGCAVGAVQLLPPGVYVAMNGLVLPVRRAQKNRQAGVFEELPEDSASREE
jgi:L-asparaginase